MNTDNIEQFLDKYYNIVLERNDMSQVVITPQYIEENREWFENTDEGYLLAVNMISEGAHYRGVNTLIMFRKTQSYLVYTQQLGRIITLMKDENPNAIVFDLVNNVENIRYNDRKLNRHKKEEHSISRIIKALENALLSS